MNKADRKKLETLVEQLRELAEAEREKVDNMSEYFSGEKVDEMENLATALEEAVDVDEWAELITGIFTNFDCEKVIYK